MGVNSKNTLEDMAKKLNQPKEETKIDLNAIKKSLDDYNKNKETYAQTKSNIDLVNQYGISNEESGKIIDDNIRSGKIKYEDLNDSGKTIYNNYLNTRPTLSNVVNQSAINLIQGTKNTTVGVLDNAYEGMSNLLFNEPATNYRDLMSSNPSQLYQNMSSKIGANSNVAKVGLDLSTALGEQVGQVLGASMGLPVWANMGTRQLVEKANDYKENGDAQTYLGAYAKSLPNAIIQGKLETMGIGDKIPNSWVRAIGGEALEELLQTPAEYVYDKIFAPNTDEAKNQSWLDMGKEALYSALLGGLTGGVIKAGNVAVGKVTGGRINLDADEDTAYKNVNENQKRKIVNESLNVLEQKLKENGGLDIGDKIAQLELQAQEYGRKGLYSQRDTTLDLLKTLKNNFGTKYNEAVAEQMRYYATAMNEANNAPGVVNRAFSSATKLGKATVDNAKNRIQENRLNRRIDSLQTEKLLNLGDRINELQQQIKEAKINGQDTTELENELSNVQKQYDKEYGRIEKQAQEEVNKKKQEKETKQNTSNINKTMEALEKLMPKEETNTEVKNEVKEEVKEQPKQEVKKDTTPKQMELPNEPMTTKMAETIKKDLKSKGVKAKVVDTKKSDSNYTEVKTSIVDENGKIVEVQLTNGERIPVQEYNERVRNKLNKQNKDNEIVPDKEESKPKKESKLSKAVKTQKETKKAKTETKAKAEAKKVEAKEEVKEETKVENTTEKKNNPFEQKFPKGKYQLELERNSYAIGGANYNSNSNRMMENKDLVTTEVLEKINNNKKNSKNYDKDLLTKSEYEELKKLNSLENSNLSIQEQYEKKTGNQLGYDNRVLNRLDHNKVDDLIYDKEQELSKAIANNKRNISRKVKEETLQASQEKVDSITQEVEELRDLQNALKTNRLDEIDKYIDMQTKVAEQYIKTAMLEETDNDLDENDNYINDEGNRIIENMDSDTLKELGLRRDSKFENLSKDIQAKVLVENTNLAVSSNERLNELINEKEELLKYFEENKLDDNSYMTNRKGERRRELSNKLYYYIQGKGVEELSNRADLIEEDNRLNPKEEKEVKVKKAKENEIVSREGNIGKIGGASILSDSEKADMAKEIFSEKSKIKQAENIVLLNTDNEEDLTNAMANLASLKLGNEDLTTKVDGNYGTTEVKVRQAERLDVEDIFKIWKDELGVDVKDFKISKTELQQAVDTISNEQKIKDKFIQDNKEGWEFIKKVSKMFNMPVELDTKEKTGYIRDDGTLVVGTKLPKDYVKHFAFHEAVHRMQQVDPKRYGELKKSIVEVLNRDSKKREKILNSYKEVYNGKIEVDKDGNINENALTDEFVANFTAKFFKDSEILNATAKTSPKAVKRFIDFVRKVFRKLTEKVSGRVYYNVEETVSGEKIKVYEDELEEIYKKLNNLIYRTANQEETTNVEQDYTLKQNIRKGNIEETKKKFEEEKLESAIKSYSSTRAREERDNSEEELSKELNGDFFTQLLTSTIYKPDAKNKEKLTADEIEDRTTANLEKIVTDEIVDKANNIYGYVKQKVGQFGRNNVAIEFEKEFVEAMDWGEVKDGTLSYFGSKANTDLYQARENFVDYLISRVEDLDEDFLPTQKAQVGDEIKKKLNEITNYYPTIESALTSKDTVEYLQGRLDNIFNNSYGEHISKNTNRQIKRKIYQSIDSVMSSFKDAVENNFNEYNDQNIKPILNDVERALKLYANGFMKQYNSSISNTSNKAEKFYEVEMFGNELYDNFFNDGVLNPKEDVSIERLEDSIRNGLLLAEQYGKQTLRLEEELDKNELTNEEANIIGQEAVRQAERLKVINDRISRIEDRINEIKNASNEESETSIVDEIKEARDVLVKEAEKKKAKLEKKMQKFSGDKRSAEYKKMKAELEVLNSVIPEEKTTALGKKYFAMRENKSYERFANDNRVVEDEDLREDIKNSYKESETYTQQSREEGTKLANDYIKGLAKDKDISYSKAKENIINGKAPIGITTYIAKEVNDYYESKGDTEGLVEMWEKIYNGYSKDAGRFIESMKALYDNPTLHTMIIGRMIEKYNAGIDLRYPEETFGRTDGVTYYDDVKNVRTKGVKTEVKDKEIDKKTKLADNSIKDYNSRAKSKQIKWDETEKENLRSYFEKTSKLRKAFSQDTRKEVNDLLKELWKESATTNYKFEKKLLDAIIDNAEMDNDFIIKSLDDIAIKNYFDQATSTFGKKVADYQTMSLLLNLRSSMNNLLSEVNSSMVEDLAVDKVGGTIGSFIVKEIEKRTSKKYGIDPDSIEEEYSQISNYLKRHHSKEETRQAIEEAKNVGLKETAQILSGIYNIQNLKYTTNTDKTVNSLTRTFKTNALDTAQKALFVTQGVSDAMISRFNEFREEQNAKKTLSDEKVIELFEEKYPEERGKFMVFNTNGKIAKMSSELKSKLNTWQKEMLSLTGITTSGDFGVGDLLIKFVKVGSNIFTRGLEFTPLGTLKSLRLIRNINAKRLAGKPVTRTEIEACRSIGRNITGTGLISLGLLLAKAGIITGKDDDDEKLQEYLEDENGKRGYLNLSRLGRLGTGRKDVETGDRLIDTDGMSPYFDLIKMGAIANEVINGKTSVISGLGESAINLLDQLPVSYQAESIFNTLSRQGVKGVVEKTLLDNFAFITPSQIKHIENARVTDYKNTYHSTGTKLAYNLGLKNALPSYKSANGNTRKYNNGGFLENFIAHNLGFTVRDVSTVDEYKVLKDISKVTEITDGMLPVTSAPKQNEYKYKDNAKNSIKFSLEDKSQYMEAYSEYYQNHIQEYINKNYSEDMEDWRKKKLGEKIVSLQQQAKKYAEKYAIEN